MKSSTLEAVKNGLLVIAHPDKPFASRNGENKNYLIDSRGAASNLKLREIIICEMVREIKKFTKCDIIGGIAKSGTTWGAWLSWELNLPFANILLDGKRSTGLQREVEGSIEGKKVILIDNWVRTGSSINKAKEVVERNGGIVEGTIVITKSETLDSKSDIVALWKIKEIFEASKILNLVPQDFIFQ